MSDGVERIPYEEFSLLHENAEEFGLPFPGRPAVRREDVEVESGRNLSALVWGAAPPDLVLLHGGAQNAHTWDTVALALDRPLVAVDLPGHGHSDGGRQGSLGLADNADDVAVVIRALAPEARAVVGMSLGGMTAISLADRHPDLVRAMVLVDVTPGVNAEKASAITAFVNGPEKFASFDEILARTVAFNPTRSVASLRRGILHNAVQLDDGSWVWRHARFRRQEPTPTAAPDSSAPRFADLWEAVSRVGGPMMLVRGMQPQSVVDDADEEELRRRRPDAWIEHVDGAGHSVQGDTPVELARLIEGFLAKVDQ
jgi:pimeloyl-ACP methyl ester carboxylesterase